MNRMMAPTGRPVLDESALTRLAIAVEDHAFTLQFVGRYREMLAGRVTRVLEAVREDDADTALDSVLSLKVSSTTAGLRELADLARLIEGKIRLLDPIAARAAAARLEAAALRADAALAAYLES
jgi:HPt (histidine-containing phosphotransfer) domain-containing protein